MEQEKYPNSNGDSAENKPTTSMNKDELIQHIGQTLAQITKDVKRGILLDAFFIVIIAWLSFSHHVENYVIYKFAIFVTFAAIIIIVSVIDWLWLKKFNSTTRQEQLAGIKRYKKRHQLLGWMLAFFFGLYILVDTIHNTSIGVIVFGILFYLGFMFVYFKTFDKTSTNKNILDLEENVSQLTEMEKP